MPPLSFPGLLLAADRSRRLFPRKILLDLLVMSCSGSSSAAAARCRASGTHAVKAERPMTRLLWPASVLALRGP